MKKVFLFFLIFGLFFSFKTQAASVLEFSGKGDYVLGQEFSVEVSFNQPSEEVNGIAGQISYDPSELRLKSIQDGGSRVTLWLTAPNDQSGTIEFSGLTPGGLLSGKLFSLKFEALKQGSVYLDTSPVKLYLNDGSGQSLEFAAVTKNFFVAPAPVDMETVQNEESLNLLGDQTPPSDLFLRVAKDESIFSGSWFAVFAAADSESGIDFFEILESQSKEPPQEGWVKVQSPYILSDQSRSSFIHMRVFDKRGNVSYTVQSPENLKHKLNFYFGIICGIIFLVIYLFWRIWTKQNEVKKAK